MNVSKIAVRAGIAAVAALLCLGLTVSCSKKDDARTPSQKTAEDKPVVVETAVETEAAAEEDALGLEDSIAAAEVENAPADTVAAQPVERPAVSPPAPTSAKAPAPAKESAPAQAPAAAAASNVRIEYIAGPKNVSVGKTISLTCNISGGEDAAVEYLWRFKNGGDVIEKKLSQPQVAVTLEKSGEYEVTCDVAEAGRTLASQQFTIRAVAD